MHRALELLIGRSPFVPKPIELDAFIHSPTRWWHRLANAMVSRGRYKKVPSLPNPTKTQIYRYFLFYGRRWWCPFGIALHRIVVNDIPVLHSHEWPHIAIILDGGYEDYTLHEMRLYRPISVKVRTHRTRHYIRLCKKESWSLIIVGPKGHDYGYTDANGHHIRRDIFLYGRLPEPSSLPITRAELEYLRAGRRFYKG